MVAATQLFATHGFNGVSVRAIATEANVNLSLISQYFGGKESLYEQCTETLYDQLRAALPSLMKSMDEDRDPEATIRRAIWGAIQMGKSNRESVLLTMRDFVERGKMEPSRRDALLVPTIRSVVDRLTPHSELKPTELQMALFGVILLLGRFIAFSRHDLNQVLSEKLSEDDMVHGLTELSLRMLGLNAASPSLQIQQ